KLKEQLLARQKVERTTPSAEIEIKVMPAREKQIVEMPNKTVKTSFILIFSIFASMFLSSCADENYIFEQNVEIPNAEWIASEKAILKVDITDTISQHNFYINVRNTEAYPYRNLYVFVKTNFPNEKSA